MPFALVFAGLLMIVTGANNTYSAFGAQLKTDFTGSKSFFPYALALLFVGALGYINDLRRFSHYFMALVIISLFLSNKGFFQNFTAAINSTPVAPTASASSGTGATAQTAVNSGNALFNPPQWFNNLLPSFMQSSTTQPNTSSFSSSLF